MPDIYCPKSIKACALRITRQDACDRAIDPTTPNSRLLTAGFADLTLSPDVEAGEDITTKNACGDICIRDKDRDRLKGFNATLMLCGVPLTVIEMLTGAQLLPDAEGNIVGGALRDAKTYEPDGSLMVELWSKNNVRNCTAEANNLYIQWLLPRSTNWEISGDLSFSNGPLEVELSGYVENNPNWLPSFPGEDFPSYVPGGGDPSGVPSGPPPTILPWGVDADPWTLEHQEAIQGGGPLAWISVGALPAPISDCQYMPWSTVASE